MQHFNRYIKKASIKLLNSMLCFPQKIQQFGDINQNSLGKEKKTYKMQKKAIKIEKCYPT